MKSSVWHRADVDHKPTAHMCINKKQTNKQATKKN